MQGLSYHRGSPILGRFTHSCDECGFGEKP